MTRKKRNHVDDLRGMSRLAIRATHGITDLVQAMHETIGGGPEILGRPLEKPLRLVNGLVYGSIRGVAGLVGAGIDLALAQLAPLLSDVNVQSDALLAVVNGVLGDYLHETKNPLEIEMALHPHGEPGGKLLVLVHGSCMNDLQWARRGHDHGAALARDLGYTPIYLLYNSGLHISANGAAFAAQMERLVAEWPVPVDEVVILAHSMGGLVTRSALHVGKGQAWTSKLRAIVFLGTPHHGAPLERAGNWVDALFGISRYSAPFAQLGRIRSAGVTDMRFGYVLDEHWHGRDRFAHARDTRSPVPLPEGLACYAVAATLSREPGAALSSDGLVPVDSALGRHEKPELTLAFPEANRSILYGAGHLDLLGSPEVYRTVLQWLSTRAAARPGSSPG